MFRDSLRRFLEKEALPYSDTWEADEFVPQQFWDKMGDGATISTTVVKNGDYYIVNGQKTFISNGIHSDLIILACKTDTKANPAHRGISLLIVDRDTPRFSRGRKLKKLGMRSQDTAELHFEDARIPVSNLLGEEGKGFYYLKNKLVQERIIACCNPKLYQ